MRALTLALVSSIPAALVFLGCGTGEPMTQGDATPPAGYHPLYVQKIAPLPATPSVIPNGPSAQISRIDVTDPQAVRLYVHLVDSNGTYLTGGANGKWKSAWCRVTEKMDNDTVEVPQYTIREITEANKESYAIALVMDHSGSMGNERALAVQNAADLFFGLKKPEDGVTVVKYDNKTGVEVPLTTSQDELRAHLQKNGLTGFGGSTAILNGIDAGVDQIAATKGFRRKAVLVFTDGMDNSSTVTKEAVVKHALSTGTIVCAIDFGDNIQKNFLREIAEATGGTYHHMYGTNEFARVFEDIYRRLRNYYVIEYTPHDYGAHDVQVRVCLPKDTLISAEAHYDNTPDVGSIALLDVQFDLNKADLKASSKRALNNVVTMMKVFPKMTIEVRGHTDSLNKTGDPDYNKKLSQRRAEAVREAIIKSGVAGERITAVGYGEAKPVADNATEEGRARNRRTEFVIVSR